MIFVDVLDLDMKSTDRRRVEVHIQNFYGSDLEIELMISSQVPMPDLAAHDQLSKGWNR